MYLIFSTPRKIKILFKMLKGIKGLRVYETKLTEYLFSNKDPSEYIPEGIKESVTIKPFNDKFVPFLKNANRIAELLKTEPIAPGTPVKIISGVYNGFTGIVKSVSDDTQEGKVYEVEISVWDRLMKAEFIEEELERLEVNI